MTTRSNFRTSRAISIVVGVVLSGIAWLLLVAPRQLDEIDGSGRRIDGGIDHNWVWIALALIVPMVCAVAVSSAGAAQRWRGLPSASAITWLMLLVAASASARTSGANVALVGAVLVGVPAAVLAVIVVAIARRVLRQ